MGEWGGGWRESRERLGNSFGDLAWFSGFFAIAGRPRGAVRARNTRPGPPLSVSRRARARGQTGAPAHDPRFGPPGRLAHRAGVLEDMEVGAFAGMRPGGPRLFGRWWERPGAGRCRERAYGQARLRVCRRAHGVRACAALAVRVGCGPIGREVDGRLLCARAIKGVRLPHRYRWRGSGRSGYVGRCGGGLGEDLGHDDRGAGGARAGLLGVRTGHAGGLRGGGCGSTAPGAGRHGIWDEQGVPPGGSPL